MSSLSPQIRIIDFTKLPLGDLSVWLRKVSQIQWEALFTGSPQPNWAAGLPTYFIRLLVTPHRGPTINLANATSRLIAGQVAAESWRQQAMEYVTQQLGGVPPDYLPDDFLIYASEVAWNEPTFHARIAKQAIRYLRQRYIILPKETPTPSFSVQVFWCLLALSCDAARQSSESQFTRQAIERLKEASQRQAQMGNWAGFWEQLVIRTARSQWRGSFDTLEADFRQALLALPLLSEPGSKSATGRVVQKVTNPQPTLKLEIPNWETQKPKWYNERG